MRETEGRRGELREGQCENPGPSDKAGAGRGRERTGRPQRHPLVKRAAWGKKGGGSG